VQIYGVPTYPTHFAITDRLNLIPGHSLIIATLTDIHLTVFYQENSVQNTMLLNCWAPFLISITLSYLTTPVSATQNQPIDQAVSATQSGTVFFVATVDHRRAVFYIDADEPYEMKWQFGDVDDPRLANCPYRLNCDYDEIVVLTLGDRQFVAHQPTWSIPLTFPLSLTNITYNL
jgi:hypothetical protein